MSHAVVLKVGFRGPRGATGIEGPIGGVGPVVTGFVVENGRYVLLQSDGTKIIGPAVQGNISESLLSGDTWPAAPQALPTNLMPQPAGEFGTAEGWTTHDGLIIADGVARFDGTSTGTSIMLIDLAQQAIAGNQYGFLLSHSARTAGASFPGMQALGNADNANGAGATAAGYYSRQMTADGAYTQARLSVSAGSILDIDFLRIHDMSEILKKKWRIVVNYVQSNGIGPGDAPDADKLANDTPEARAIVIPSQENSVRGSFLDAEGIGVPMLMSDPIQHLSGNVGGGPAGAFARTFCDGLRDDEVLVYVATGYSGGGRLAVGDVWNRESDGVAWLNMLKQVDALIARAPEGSTVAGMRFCQGEADLAENVGDLHTETIRGDIELLRARWGQFPVVVSEIGWADTTRADVANMIASQAKLDSDSGDVLSLPLCRYVPRPEGSTFLADGLHYDQPTQRVRGGSEGTAMLELNYGGPKP